MKIMILGLGKSGTTALLYKVAAGLPGCHAFSGGMPGKYIGDYEDAIYKHTYEERKGKDFDVYRTHLNQESYDKMVWMARDPRDVAVSRMLYRWNRGCMGHKKQFRAHLELVKEKERVPSSVSFLELCRYAAHGSWPAERSAVLNEELERYHRMTEFVRELGSDWFVYNFERMVAGEAAGLSDYLGFDVDLGAEVPSASGKAKVVRKKASGDWRHWFTEDDVALFKPIYRDYMQVMGYDCEDWSLSADPVIEPEYASAYMQGLIDRLTLDTTRRLKSRARSFFARQSM